MLLLLTSSYVFGVDLKFSWKTFYGNDESCIKTVPKEQMMIFNSFDVK